MTNPAYPDHIVNAVAIQKVMHPGRWYTQEDLRNRAKMEKGEIRGGVKTLLEANMVEKKYEHDTTQYRRLK